MTQQRGKVVLISGGMGGVGSATANLLTENGYAVALMYRNSSAHDVAEKKALVGEQVFFVQCDIADPIQTQRAVDEVLAHFGAIDICIHAAVGKITRKTILDMQETEFRKEFEVGLFGAFHLFSAVAPFMKERRSGTLIGVTSVTLEAGGAGARMGAYSAAKAALRGLLRELHRELAPLGVGVYAVAPDLLKTALTADLPEKYFEFAEAVAGKGLMTPQEVAQTILKVCKGDILSGNSVRVSTGEVTAL